MKRRTGSNAPIERTHTCLAPARSAHVNVERSLMGNATSRFGSIVASQVCVGAFWQKHFLKWSLRANVTPSSVASMRLSRLL